MVCVLKEYFLDIVYFYQNILSVFQFKLAELCYINKEEPDCKQYLASKEFGV